MIPYFVLFILFSILSFNIDPIFCCSYDITKKLKFNLDFICLLHLVRVVKIPLISYSCTFHFTLSQGGPGIGFPCFQQTIDG